MTTKEEVLRLAEESGFDTDDGCAYLRYNHDAYANVTQQITKLIKLAKAQECEACAKLCDEISIDNWNLYKGHAPYKGNEEGRLDQYIDGKNTGASDCAEAIRNRESKS